MFQPKGNSELQAQAKPILECSRRTCFINSSYSPGKWMRDARNEWTIFRNSSRLDSQIMVCISGVLEAPESGRCDLCFPRQSKSESAQIMGTLPNLHESWNTHQLVWFTLKQIANNFLPTVNEGFQSHDRLSCSPSPVEDISVTAEPVLKLMSL